MMLRFFHNRKKVAVIAADAVVGMLVSVLTKRLVIHPLLISKSSKIKDKECQRFYNF